MARQRRKHHFWRNLLILIVLFGIYLYWGNRSIETDEATFTSGALPAGFDGCRIVQLSDLHGKYFGKGNEGIRQFKELTKGLVDEYIIVPMPHGEGEDCCLHLMSIISFVDTDKAVVYSKYMPVFFREYLIARGIQLIECNDEEYDYLGSNLLALEPGKCVLIAGCPDIKKKVEDAGVEVFTYEGKEVSYRGTGGPTCLTCPLTRL